MAYGLSNGYVTVDVTWPQRCCEAVRSAILPTAWLLVFLLNARTVNNRCLYWPCAGERHWGHLYQTLTQFSAKTAFHLYFAYGSVKD